jgi:hypothetical protein
MDYEYQGKNEEIHKLNYIVYEIYVLSIRFQKIVFVCEYQLLIQDYSSYTDPFRGFSPPKSLRLRG